MIRLPFCRNRSLRWVAMAVAICTAIASANHSRAQTAPAAVHLDAKIEQRGHISVATVGKGSPVILIPGLSSPRDVWYSVVPELARTHRVYLVQVNGFAGDEPRGNARPGILEGIVADLDGFIAQQNLGKPAVVGHSMGGLVGMMLAARHPDRVGRLLVVDAAPFIGAVMGVPDVATIRPRAQQMLDGLPMAAPAMAAAADTPVTQDPGGIMSNSAAGRIQVANWSRKAVPQVMIQALYEDMVTDLRPEIAKITAQPFTVLYAAGVGLERAKAVWEPQYADANAKLVPVADSYHFIMLDQPAAFRTALVDFLK